MIEAGPSLLLFGAQHTSPFLSQRLPIHFMDTTELPLPTVETAPKPTGLRSYFREVPWRWSDLLICFAPDLAFLVGAAVGLRPTLRALRWFFLPSIVLFELWMLVCPMWIVQRAWEHGRVYPPYAQYYARLDGSFYSCRSCSVR